MLKHEPDGNHPDRHSGTVIGIFLRPAAGQSTVPVERVRAVSGRGLEGDYFFNQRGPTAGESGGRLAPDLHVTLIELEALQAAAGEYGLHLDLGESRRNLLTQGVSLNDLVGLQFRIGEVLLQGIRLCEPCSHLARLTHKDVVPALVHRGGLRARILIGGDIRVGDPVYMMEKQIGPNDLRSDLEEELNG